jgi:hypothetical protein
MAHLVTEEEPMPPKKKRERRRPARKTSARKRTREAPASPAKADDRRLADLTEALDIMLPELTARIAAVEHVLVQMEICEREDLIRAREFVDERPRGGFAGEEQD